MTILALEFSSPQRSTAVLGPSGKALASGPDQGKSTHAFALIEEALLKAQLQRTDIECIAVGVGPGSYTGIRVAIAIAQGWEVARGVKLLAVSTPDVLAEQARRQGLTGLVTCVIDAQRKEFYVAVYDLGEKAARPAGPLHIESATQVKERGARGELLIGPEEQFGKNHLIFPDALVLAELAASRSDFLRGDQLEPIYLRQTTFVKAATPGFSPATA